MNRLVLASGSAARAQVLQAAGVSFAAVKPDVDEVAIRASLTDASPEAVAVALAEAKAATVSAVDPQALVLGCDQVLVFEGRILGKCATLAAARALLLRMAGQTHALVTAEVLMQGGRPLWRHVETARLTMRRFEAAFLDDYLEKETDEILFCVGCYRLEGIGIQLFERIEGDYFAVLGLPLLPLLAGLREYGGLPA